MAKASLSKFARQYAAMGRPVFPVHGIVDGKCTCGDDGCRSPGKHPLTDHGFKDATLDKTQIKAWWNEWPWANIATPTGDGLVVVDIDTKEAAEALRADGALKRTVKVRTGRGWHYFYSADKALRSRRLREGVDLKADRGYVLLPPSLHRSGRRYKFRLQGKHRLRKPQMDDLAEFPHALAQREPRTQQHEEDASAIHGGTRNNALTSLAGTMRRRGMTQSEIGAAISAVNTERCSPPLPAREVEEIARSVAGYEPASVPFDLIFERATIHEVNAAELVAKGAAEPPPSLPVFDIPEIFIKGWSHLLAGYPKAGKSELLAALCRAWRGERIVFFTEEPETVWQARLRGKPKRWSHVQLVFGVGLNPWEILNRVTEGDETVVIIDTVRALLGLEDESNNAEIGRRLQPFIGACREQSKTLIFAHHLRKQSGDHGRAISGGHAFLGAVDVALELRHVNPQQPTRRQLSGYARIVQIPDLVYERTDKGFRTVSVGGGGGLVEVKGVLMKALTSMWQKTGDLRDSLEEPKPSTSQVTKALEALASDGAAQRKPPISEGKKQGVTYKWRLP